MTPKEVEQRQVDQRVRLTGTDAVRLHLTLAAGLSLCISAFCLEIIRALDGHAFSWLYVFEWPLFAGFGLYMWWNLLNGYDRRPQGTSSSDLPTKESDVELEAWQSYLRNLQNNNSGDDEK